MSPQRPSYRISLLLFTLLALIPQGFMIYQFGQAVFLTGQTFFLYPAVPGLTATNTSYSDFSHAVMWKGKFARLIPDFTRLLPHSSLGTTVVTGYSLRLSDPLTNETIGPDLPLKSGHYQLVALADRLFLIGSPTNGNVLSESYEFGDQGLRPFQSTWPQYDPLILIDSKLFRLQIPPATPKPIVTAIEEGTSASPREIVIPQFFRPATPQVGFSKIEKTTLVCLNDEETIFTFVQSQGRVYFRLGLPLRSTTDPDLVETYGANQSGAIKETDPDAQWQTVQSESTTVPICDASDVAIVDSKPTVLIVEDMDSRLPRGHLYQLEGHQWQRLASIRFPFGSVQFRLLSAGNGLGPYVVATSSTGTAFVYQWESGELREVAGQGPELTWTFVKRDLKRHAGQYGIILSLGLIPCLVIWLLSQCFTSNDYAFGLQTVNLASLGQRALAKSIDLSLLAILVIFVAMRMLSQIRWFEVAESLHNKIAHPDFLRFYQTLYVEVLTILIACLFLIVTQGIWGVTPGKWLCGLKTLRTTLRPCGITRSLVREFLLLIDSTYLLWWIPGSLTIGLTEHRQRIGDLMSDTIVVRSGTRQLHPPTESNHDNPQ